MNCSVCGEDILPIVMMTCDTCHSVVHLSCLAQRASEHNYMQPNLCPSCLGGADEAAKDIITHVLTVLISYSFEEEEGNDAANDVFKKGVKYLRRKYKLIPMQDEPIGTKTYGAFVDQPENIIICSECGKRMDTDDPTLEHCTCVKCHEHYCMKCAHEIKYTCNCGGRIGFNHTDHISFHKGV